MCGHGTLQRTDRRVFSLTPVRSIILLIVFISYHNNLFFFSSKIQKEKLVLLIVNVQNFDNVVCHRM